MKMKNSERKKMFTKDNKCYSTFILKNKKMKLT